jgi:(R)-2-hydroxyacyl-CoA dehydratese activating ATPase
MSDHYYFAGLDLGSTMTKVLIIDENDKTLATIKNHTGPEHRRHANKVMVQALEQAHLTIADISYVITTGYGRMNVPFSDRQVTELTCHARGILHLFPSARTVLDIGGQDAKGLKLDSKRILTDFIVNDKCAAGTGRFLEIIARKLGIEIEELSTIAARATAPAAISNTCTIFAEQEVVAKISEGENIANIIAGLHSAVASRAVTMLKRLKIEPDIVFTGGVAKNRGMVQAVSEQLRREILVPPDPLITGALGAALLAKETAMAAKSTGDSSPNPNRKLAEATFFES